ncbi:MAG TPA: hypothetical protein VGV59_03950 [Pyrinomonadaceae bacterium]|nr:hypothetical protein [Pyrinomonadaceae bacterium]
MRQKSVDGRDFGRVWVVVLVGALIAACLVYAFAQTRQRPRRATLPAPDAPRAAAAPGETIEVRRGGDLQRALNRARPGDTITLEAGATFVGPFTLPKKTGDAWITIRTSAPDSSLPAENVRLTPSHAHALPKLVSPGRNESALQTAAGAHHYRIVGVEFRPADERMEISDLVKLGDGSRAQDTPDKVPHHLVIDRCYLHAFPTQSAKRGIALNSGATEILNSHLSDFKAQGQDSQAIGGWNGPGPYKIINNYLEAAGENVMFGGAAGGLTGVIPSDIEVRRNHFSKPLRWKAGAAGFTTQWSIKNIFELKNARRVLIEGNLFEHNWLESQSGYAIVLTVRGDSGPQATIEDVVFRHNIVRGTSSAFNILGQDTLNPSGQGKNVEISNNLFEDIDGERWGGSGEFMKISDMPGTVVRHNTIVQTGNIITAYGTPSPGFVFADNIAWHNDYGIIGDSRAPGLSTIDTYFPRALIRNNLIIGANADRYPTGNLYPAQFSKQNFADRARGNYRLAASSPYRGRGTDGRDPGCDFDALEAATAGVAAVVNAPSPSSR